jgi:hypothetical protein
MIVEGTTSAKIDISPATVDSITVTRLYRLAGFYPGMIYSVCEGRLLAITEEGAGAHTYLRKEWVEGATTLQLAVATILESLRRP